MSNGYGGRKNNEANSRSETKGEVPIATEERTDANRGSEKGKSPRKQESYGVRVTKKTARGQPQEKYVQKCLRISDPRGRSREGTEKCQKGGGWGKISGPGRGKINTKRERKKKYPKNVIVEGQQRHIEELIKNKSVAGI